MKRIDLQRKGSEMDQQTFPEEEEELFEDITEESSRNSFL